MGIHVVFVLVFTSVVVMLVIAACLKQMPKIGFASKSTVLTGSDKNLNWLVKKIRWADNRLSRYPNCKKSTKTKALGIIEISLGLRNETCSRKAIDVLMKFNRANPMSAFSKKFGTREHAYYLMFGAAMFYDGEIRDTCKDMADNARQKLLEKKQEDEDSFVCYEEWPVSPKESEAPSQEEGKGIFDNDKYLALLKEFGVPAV